ncbi:uncharacterized protein KIAA2026 [Lampris incognitus]|uniref:uncharacterized protein KIAA2026 n=1 Tax=Lampris incognitus TaxID=2546036 RepID=UPI0024B574F4|nr:uncharacterized protein KIAA2026 [Lampris incognitus]
MTDEAVSTCNQQLFSSQDLTVADSSSRSQQSNVLIMSSSEPVHNNISTECTDLVTAVAKFSNGNCEIETEVESHCDRSGRDVANISHHIALNNEGVSEISTSDLSLPEVCISTNSTSFEEDMNYEVQQAYRIFTGFLLEKHKGITSPFLHPIGYLEAQHGIEGVRGRGQAQLRQSMCLRRMEEKFVSQEYETITQFVADFRLMLENCYRYHGVDHWVSKQAQKLEIMLEQKLTLLSRVLREKTTLAVTSKGRFGVEEERSSGGTSTRRRSAPRSLSTITVGGHESIMVQTLRLEEQQRAKEERRQRELEKKEAEEMSAKEVEEWEQNLLSLASPHHVDTLWELPAIGHFLCLAQTALNLPEIIFFELERCLLMPRCSPFLSKIMTSLLCPPQRRATLHRRPALPYRRWESELRQRVLGWYRAIGVSHDQPTRAEQLGLCHQFFSVVGEESPLEETPFHLLPFYQRVWLLKGLCDNVYETQKDVQDAVLAQPIHECRESILGYDSMENAFIHFPHFCGADLRIYCQSPSTLPPFPFPSVWVRRIEIEPRAEAEESDGLKDGVKQNDGASYVASMETRESEDSGQERAKKPRVFERENGDREKAENFISWSPKEEDESDSGSSNEDDSNEDSKSNLIVNAISISSSHSENSLRGSGRSTDLKEEPSEFECHPNKLTIKQELGCSIDSGRTITAETREPCLSVGEHSYTGKSPARLKNLASPARATNIKVEGEGPNLGHRMCSCLEFLRSNTVNFESEEHNCCCGTSEHAARLSSESTQNSSEERVSDKIKTKKKRRKKKREREQLLTVRGEHKQLWSLDRTRPCQTQAVKTTIQRAVTAIKRKDKRKRQKHGKKLDLSKKIKDEPPTEPSFKLVCTSLEELRDLISKTEDELDELESTKKRSGRWYFKREAVKDLHITLIRLLNELSPWEPKLAKAYQRNRLRLKKEYDDFKKHPDYNNFVREECLSSSSDDEERGIGREVCSLPEQYREVDEEELEHAVPRSLWTGAGSRQFRPESIGGSIATQVTTNRQHKHLPYSTEDINLLQRGQTGNDKPTSTPESELGPRGELDINDQCKDSNRAWATAAPSKVSLALRPTILHTTIGLPKGYTPIPTLLAKSVGNKVTLMKRPADYLKDSSNAGQSTFLPSSLVVPTKSLQAQTCPSQPQQNSQKMDTQGPQQIQADELPVKATSTTALPKALQAKPTQMAVPKSPVQVVYKVSEGLGHLLSKDNSNQVKISVQPIVDQNTGEKIMQQVVILPSNLLIQKTEGRRSQPQEQSNNTQAHVPRVTSPLCMSTSVPGFTIPDSRIPIQEVAPLTDNRMMRTPSPSVSCQQNSLNTAGLMVAETCRPQGSTPQRVMSPSTTTKAVSIDAVKPTDPKQELKTVCIRDSQSILVTTRGGNTGIVKVQTSSDQNAPGTLPNSPIITISPQFKAFLVSKTSPPLSPSAPSNTSSCAIPATTNISEAQSQKQIPSVLKSLSTVATPLLTAVTGNIPLPGPRNQITGTTASLVKSPVIVPSLSSSSTPIVSTQTQLINKPGTKRAGTDELSQFSKFILVTPSSSSSNVAVAKVTSSSTTPLPSSRVMLISQTSAASSTTTSMESRIPNQTHTTGATAQPLATSLSSEALKIGLSLGPPACNISSLSKIKNITMPSGVQICLPGRTSIGPTISDLPQSNSKRTSISVSKTGPLTATTTGLVLVKSSNMTTSSPAQTSSPSALITSPQLQGISSPTLIPQSDSSKSVSSVVTPAPGCIIKKDLGVTKGLLSNNTIAQITTTAQHSQSKTTPTTLLHQSLGGIGRASLPVIPAPQTASIVTHKSASLVKPATTSGNTNLFSAATTTCVSATTATSTIQQRIVINTTTALAAGTQIILNNTRFVVPAQGLGPGSHVLIISSPAPQVPNASTPTTTTVSPLQVASPVTAALQEPALPGPSLARLPGGPTLSSPVVACIPTIGSPVLAATPNITPVRLSSQDPASPIVGAPTLVSALTRLNRSPALVTPVITSTPALGPALPTVKLPAGTPTLAHCSPVTSTLSPTRRFPTSPLSSHVLPSTPAITLPSPVLPAQASILPTIVPPSETSGSQGLASATPALTSTSVATLSPGIQPQQKVHRIPESSTATPIQQASLYTGINNTLTATVVQPTLEGTWTQELPTVAVPPVVSTVPRMQSLPVATVLPIGSVSNNFQKFPVANMSSSSDTVLMTLGQPVRSIKTNIHPSIILASQELGKPSLEASAPAQPTNVVSKLLISPDGAVLNTVQGPLCPADLAACPKPLAKLVVSTSSSTGGVLSNPLTNNSSLQPTQAGTSSTVS